MPTTRAYTDAITAWGSVGDPKSAEDLFLEYRQRYQDLKAPELNPNTEILAALIRAWLKAAEEEEVDQNKQIARLSRGVEWLESMIDGETAGGPPPTHDLFLAVLKSANSCAFDSPQVLDIAYRTFGNLRESRHHTDARAYTMLLRVALLALSKPENDEIRTKFVTRLVKACCEDGLLSKSK